MNAIILCAGSARRFFPNGFPGGVPQPKCLLPLPGDETILDRLLRQLHAREHHVVLGTGCGHELVAEHAARYDDVRCVFNPHYESTNSIVTLWELREFVTNNTLIINGDLVVGDEAFSFFDSAPSPQLLVKRLSEFDDDTYRVVFNEEYSIERMGKELGDGPSPQCAAFTGISRVGCAEWFLKEIENLLGEGSNQTWPTTAYRNLIGRVAVRAVDVGSTLFFDVDTPAEHEEAQRALALKIAG